MLDEQVEQASRAMKSDVTSVALKILCVLGEKRSQRAGYRRNASVRHKAISRNIWRSCATKACAAPWDANRVFYRVGDVRTLEVVSLIREVFCGF